MTEHLCAVTHLRTANTIQIRFAISNSRSGSENIFHENDNPKPYRCFTVNIIHGNPGDDPLEELRDDAAIAGFLNPRRRARNRYI